MKLDEHNKVEKKDKTIPDISYNQIALNYNQNETKKTNNNHYH